MPDFLYTPLFSIGQDTTEYEAISRDHVAVGECDGRPVLKVAPEGLTLLAERAFHDVAFFLRPSHLDQLAAILKDPESSANDRTVALELLKNAMISADGVLPMCQDTGTAIINAKKGQRVFTGGGDEEALSRGVFNAYTKNYFRGVINKQFFLLPLFNYAGNIIIHNLLSNFI